MAGNDRGDPSRALLRIRLLDTARIWPHDPRMPELVASPTTIAVPGEPPKEILEFVGLVNTGTEGVSIAVMTAPQGWEEPGQRPEFDEWTVVLEGSVRVEHEGGELTVSANQAVLARAGEWVRYSTPTESARYVAVCMPAFSPETVNRDD